MMARLGTDNGNPLATLIVTEQHESIMALADRIDAAASESAIDVDLVTDTMKTLIKLINLHFRHEETIMMDRYFRSFQSHKRDHDFLIETLSRVTAALITGLMRPSEAIGTQVKASLIVHDREYDHALMEFLTRD